MYRDRAKERREAFGTEDSTKRNDYSPVHERSYPTSSYRMPTQSNKFIPIWDFSSIKSIDPSVPSDSIGSKLMKKHGWQEGQGLGKKLQGRADPLQVSLLIKQRK